jgi:hypothetical protein
MLCVNNAKYNFTNSFKKSEDNGNTWRHFNTGLDYGDSIYAKIEIVKDYAYSIMKNELRLVRYNLTATPNWLATPTIDNIGIRTAQANFGADLPGDFHYVVVAQGNPQPSDSLIVLGQDASGLPAVASGSEFILNNVSDSLMITGLQPGTQYTAYVVFKSEAVNMGTVESVDFETLPVYTVTFNVDNVGGAAVENATVSFNNTDQLTNTAGSTVFGDVEPAADIAYTITATGYQQYDGTVSVVDKNVVVSVPLIGVGICNNLEDAGITAYPNPVGDVLTIDGVTLGDLVKVTGVNGVEVASVVADGTAVKVDMSNVCNGTYIVSVNGATGVVVKK